MFPPGLRNPKPISARYSAGAKTSGSPNNNSVRGPDNSTRCCGERTRSRSLQSRLWAEQPGQSDLSRGRCDGQATAKAAVHCHGSRRNPPRSGPQRHVAHLEFQSTSPWQNMQHIRHIGCPDDRTTVRRKRYSFAQRPMVPLMPALEQSLVDTHRHQNASS